MTAETPKQLGPHSTFPRHDKQISMFRYGWSEEPNIDSPMVASSLRSSRREYDLMPNTSDLDCWRSVTALPAITLRDPRRRAHSTLPSVLKQPAEFRLGDSLLIASSMNDASPPKTEQQRRDASVLRYAHLSSIP